MKSNAALLGLILAMSLTLQVAGEAQDATPYTIAGRGAHHRIWERQTFQTLRDGRSITNRQSYVQLGVGMHYWKDDQWIESHARFRLFPGGAVADEGPFKLILAPDVSQEPVIDLLTPDQNRFQVSPRWLAYFDRDTRQSTIVAVVKPCIGELVEPNVIIFPDAFDDIRAAIKFTYQPWGIEQEVLFLESGPLRPEDYGLQDRGGGNVVLEMWSAFHVWPEGGTVTTSIEGGLPDVKLVWGEAQIGIGKAFSVGDEENSIAVGKTWTRVDGQGQFLIEAIRQSDLAPLLARLPQQAQANNPARRARGLARRPPAADRAGLLAQAAERADDREKRTQLAAIQPATARLGPAVSIDYSIVTTISGMRFLSDTTYLVTNSVTLSSTTTIEGNSCIKFSNPSASQLKITGPIDCQTSPYRPAWFTGIDDNTVGEIITGSTGNPGTNRYAGRALDLSSANTTYDLHDLRFRYPEKALYVGSSSASLNLSHSQISFANCGIVNIYPNGVVRNVLIHDSGIAISGSASGTNRLEHATIHRVGTLLATNVGQLTLTNSLIISVTNGLTYTGTNNAAILDDTGIFQTVGAASHYLSASSTNRNNGITNNVNATLLADLKKRTTYPPLVLTNKIASSTNFWPQVPRDTDQVDRGYHYDCVDFVANQISVSNAAVTVFAGTVIGVYGGNTSHGFRLEDGSSFRTEGFPLEPCRFVRYNAVQEQANTNWSAPTAGRTMVDAPWGGSPRPVAQFRFTEWSAPAGGHYHLAGDYSTGPDTAQFGFAHCQFYGGLISTLIANVAFTNCLFDRVWALDLSTYSYYFNNLHLAGSFNVDGNYGTHEVADSFFDRTAFDTYNWVGTYNHHNGYITNETHLSPEGSNNVVVSNMVYHIGPLGRYYHGTNLLADKGSRKASEAGLFWFTATTNQVPDAFSIVDLGLHYPRTASAAAIASTNTVSGYASVKQSSTNFGGVPTRAVDGNTDGDFTHNSVTSTDANPAAWWEIDLGSVKGLEAVRLWNRTDCCGWRLTNSWVLVSDNPFTSTNLATTTNQAGVSSYYLSQVNVINLVPVYRSGRYVRVQLGPGNIAPYLSLAEVEILSSAVTAGADADGDLVDDWLEDRNGNGMQDPEETDARTADSEFVPDTEPLGPSSRRTPLVISEIVYNAAPGGNEYIELYNTHHLSQKLDGFSLFNTATKLSFYTFGPGSTLAAGSFTNILLANGTLPPTLRLQLRNDQNAVLLEVEYADTPPWPKAADGTGHSLVLAKASYGEGDPRAWAASARLGGSPGYAETNKPDLFNVLRINEFLVNSNSTAPQFIELHNTSSQTLDVSGCFLSCSAGDLIRFKIPAGTVLPPRGFYTTYREQWSFTLSTNGEQIFLTSPDASRVIDSVRFEGQAPLISMGRHPDGAPGFNAMTTSTPGATNSGVPVPSVVISELMFNPISGSFSNEYVELFNRSTGAVNLVGWSLGNAISFTFTNTVVVPATNYLIIGKDTNVLKAIFTNLVFGSNLFGNYSRQLSDRSDKVTLLAPGNIVADEVTYADGGRWGVWADGGGSSLELIDPRADNRLPSNWGDSDETSKSVWTTLTNRAVLDWGMVKNNTNVYLPDSLEIILLGPGECLLDNLFAGPTNNLLSNSTFESGTNGWTVLGTHDLSSLETNTGGGLGGDGSTRSLHLRASGRGDIVGNRVLSAYTSMPATGSVHSLSTRARWLRGETNILLRTHGNWMELAGTLTVPTNLGSPGLVNSRFLTNSGPAIFDVLHWPVLPQAGQKVRVSARVHDPDGVTNIVLRYRIDPSSTLVSVPMNDAGTNGDLIAGDGLYSAPVPGQGLGVLAAFRIEASDAFGMASRFPAAQVIYPTDTEQRECLVRFGDPPASGSFGTYRMWMTTATATQWTNRLKVHNSPLDVTFVYQDRRVIHNAGALYSGSPYTAFLDPNYNGPLGKLCGYELAFPSDDRLLGSTDGVLDWPIRDNTGQREQVAYWMAEQLGLRPNYRRFLHLFVNGVGAQDRFTGGTRVYEDTQQPNGDFLDQWFNDKKDGELHKLDEWIEYPPVPTFYDNGKSNVIGPTLTSHLTTNFATTNLVKKLARYRWMFPKRGGSAQAHDYTSLFKLVDAANTNATSYTVSATNILDAEQWLRVWAFEDVVVNSDAFGNGLGGKNMFLYRPTTNDLWQMLLWDLDSALLGSTNYSLTDASDTNNYRLQTNAPFLRAYWRGIKDAVNGPLQSSNYTAVLDGNYAALNNNGISVKTPTEAVGGNLSLVGWLDGRRIYLSNQLNTVAAPFSITNGTTSTVSNIVLGGKAPVEIAYIRISGRSTNELVSWNTVTNWSFPYTLVTGANPITNLGLDRFSNPIATNGIVITKSP